MTERYSIVGRRLPRTDSFPKSIGEALYTGDMGLSRMLHGKILRSPYPHARILRIDTGRAERLSGVKAIVTGQDTLGHKYGGFRKWADQYPLARGKVRYVGDEVAAVAAVDEDTAQEALGLVQVEYEELPAVFDPEAAMRPGAPLIHDQAGGNISWKYLWEFGDVEGGFAHSDYVREDKFTTQPVTHCPIEPHTSMASFDCTGRLTLWTSTQNPHVCRHGLALTLGMSEAHVRVVKPHVGGGFGGKSEMLPHEFCAALLAIKTGRPVRIACSREEVTTATRQRHPMIIQLKAGVKRDGTLMAKHCRIVADGGAYTGIGPIALYLSGAFLHLPYRQPNVRFEGYRVYTNKPTSAAQRGHGIFQICFAVESQMDLIAQELGLDPVELRLRNALRPGEVTANGMRITSCGLEECIERVLEATGWKKKRGQLPPNRGLGLACNAHLSGVMHDPRLVPVVLVKVHNDGLVSLTTGAPDIGQGSDSLLAQIVAEELGVPIEHVRVVAGDTEIAPMDLGAYSSRITFFVGNAARAAAAEVKGQLLEIAAEALEASPHDLEAQRGRVCVKGNPERGMALSEVLKRAFSSKKLPIVGKGQYAADVEPLNLETGIANISPTYTFGAQVAEVEVDRETGQVKVLSMTVAHDCGLAINPMSVEGQVEGSVAGGMGQALWEELVRDGGRTLNPSLLDLKIPTALDMASTHTIPVETIDPQGPFGAKESGEGMQVSVAPAIANAIDNAIGVRLKDLPMTPEGILQALKVDVGEGRLPAPSGSVGFG